MAKTKDLDKDAIRILYQAGNLTSLKKMFEYVQIKPVSAGTGITSSTLSKYKNHPGLIKTEVYILLADYFDLTPQEIMTLALNDMGYKPKRSK